MSFKSTRKSRRHRTPKPEQAEPFFQPKLKVGAPNDKYEKEADAVADKVVSGSESPQVQTKVDSRMEEDRAVQEKHDEARPQVQRMDQEEAPIQQMTEEEAPIQKMGEEEEEAVQMKEEEEAVQMKGEEEEEAVQMKEEEEEAIQMKCATSSRPAADLGKRLRASAGKGKPLAGATKEKMETGFQRDLSEVNIHTDAAADEMAQALGAKAFTRGNDIYFRSGEYQPGTTAGQRLLAHELTHTVQQKKGDDPESEKSPE